MKIRLIAIGMFLVGLVCLAQAQFNGCQAGFCSKVATGGFTPSCTQSTNWLARATNIVSTLDKQNDDALLCGLETDGVGCSTTIDALYVYATVDRTTAVLNMCSASYVSTENGTVSFAAYRGYTGDGSTFFLNTTFNPVSATSPFYVLDSATFGIYVLSNITSGGSNADNMGAANVGQASISAFFFGNSVWFVNGTVRSVASSTSQGQWIATRTASNAVALYRNGNTTAVDSGTTASDFVPFSPFYVFGTDTGGSLSNPTVVEMSAAIMGKGLSAANMAKVAARINTRMCNMLTPVNVYAC